MYLSLLQIKNFRCFDGNEHMSICREWPEGIMIDSGNGLKLACYIG